MTDREPVNIMGVFAFPDPDKDKRVIRFIDSDYHTLFTIRDGESIVITLCRDQGAGQREPHDKGKDGSRH